MQKINSENIEESVKDSVWNGIQDFLNIGLHFGEGDKQVDITIGILLLIIISFIVTSLFLKWIRLFSTRKMEEIDKPKFISVFRFIKYIVYVLVVFVILSVAGINITPFLAASAALLVGVGLALQEVFQDIMAGLFIIVDKSLLVSDVIEIDGKVGRVIDIKLRTTRAITRDDKVIIIPNHKFITDTIFNYTQNHRTTREFIKVGVAYGSDTELVQSVLLKSIENQSGVLSQPEPFVLFEDFGDSALVFSLYFYIDDSFIDPKIKSEIRFRMDKLFRENDITIPFPQRDVHLQQKP